MIDSDDEQQVGGASGSDKADGGVASDNDDVEEPEMSDRLRKLLAKV